MEVQVKVTLQEIQDWLPKNLKEPFAKWLIQKSISDKKRIERKT